VSALALRGLTKRYGEVPAVDSLDLEVERGTLYGFLGPNGAGKTTTIRMALGLVFPDAGEVELLGTRMFASEDSGGALRRAGALIEEPAFWPWLSGRRNLECFARAAGPPADREARLRRIDEVLDIVSLTNASSKRVKAYSQGMRQRLGIALALLGAPELLVLDEPTNGLDPMGMREIRTLLRRLADAGTTVFVSSHLLGEVEAMCDRVGVLAHGRLVAEGTPAELRSSGGRVRLEVGDPEAARRVLRSLGVPDADGDGRAPGPGTLRLTLPPRLSAAGLNRALVEAGAEVSALVPENDTLEDVFLALVEGDDAPR
jgi:ABC-2 type transport system ATP-binding protein